MVYCYKFDMYCRQLPSRQCIFYVVRPFGPSSGIEESDFKFQNKARARAHTDTHTHTHVYVCVCVCMYVCVCVYIYIYILEFLTFRKLYKP
jgi:hypothetical protein